MVIRAACCVLAAFFATCAAMPAEAAFLFGRKMRHKMVRTFRPIKKIKKIKGIKKGFTGSRSRPKRRTYRRTRSVRRRR